MSAGPISQNARRAQLAAAAEEIGRTTRDVATRFDEARHASLPQGAVVGAWDRSTSTSA